MILGKLICWIKRKHPRRRLVSENAEKRIVQCPRCGDQLVYKKAKAAKLQAVA